MTRVVDELDRVTLVDYPDDALDVVYGYDAPGPFALGRSISLSYLLALTRLSRSPKIWQGAS